MIIDYDTNFNEYEEKVMNKYGGFDYDCPSCPAQNQFTRHAQYERNYCHFDFDLQVFKERELVVLRIKCKSCNHTHAVLPAGIIPYRFYTQFWVLKAIAFYFLKANESKSKTSKAFSVDRRIIQFYIAKYIALLKNCFLLLKTLSCDWDENEREQIAILKTIRKNFNEIGFAWQYFDHVKRIYMMSRERALASRRLWVGIKKPSFSPTHTT